MAKQIEWQAEWIWPRGHAWTVNFHGLAQKEFIVSEPVQEAILRLSAYTGYTVYLNGELLGRGPEPNDPWYQTYDTYNAAPLMKIGQNVLTVAVYNYGIGVHWQNRGRGGLIAQLDIDQFSGRQIIATDASWRVKTDPKYALHSPRVFWSAGFLETTDFRRMADWSKEGWEVPEVVGPALTKPWTRLLPREIPLLREEWYGAVTAEKGQCTLPRFHCVGFENILPTGQAGLVSAHGTIYSESPQDVLIRLECDDAFKLFVNGAQAAELNYSEHFSRTRVWRGKDDYDQVHYGMGDVNHQVHVSLAAGDNHLTMTVDQGPGGWGFILALHDPITQAVLDLPISWERSGPWESTGLNDSLDAVMAEGSAGPRGTHAPSAAWSVTDYATLMTSELRTGSFSVSPSETTLQPGEWCVFDLDKVRVGYPQLTLTADAEAVLDIGFSQILDEDRRIGFSNGGRMKAVDRLFLRVGEQTWQPSERRTARFLHLSCRAGGSVKITGAGIYAIGYPVEEVGAFACSDETLNGIWRTSLYTTKLLMQHGWQDCLKREQGTLNTSSFNYGSRGAACAFGDFDLAKKNLRQAFRTQNETGWFDSHGISSPNSDEVTECLWLAVWLKDYHLYSGDTGFVEEVFENLEDNLRFFHKGINRHGLIEGRNRPLAWLGQGIYLDDSLLYGPYMGLFGGELFGFNALYFAALEAAAALAQALGETAKAALYTRRAERVRRAVRERFWDAERKLYRDWRDGDTLAETYHPILQITALHFSIGDKAQLNALRDYLCEDLGLPDSSKPDYPLFTFGFYFYFLEGLFRHDRVSLAYDLLRGYYGRWLELGATTFGEFFVPGPAVGKTALDEEYEVHAYGTSAHLHFYTHILGIEPLEPGFAKVRIAPQPGDLTWAEGKIATPRGLIAVSWRQETGEFALEVMLPPDVTYELVGLPTESRCTVKINGQVIVNRCQADA